MTTIDEYYAYLGGNKKNKYGAMKTEYNGEMYDSKAEAHRAFELDMMEKSGLINDLERQKKFPVSINGKVVFTYIADFTYIDLEKKKLVVEDVKGMRTPMFNLKKKCVEAQYEIEITLV